MKVKNKMKSKVKQSESDKLNNMSVSVHRIEVNRVSESENQNDMSVPSIRKKEDKIQKMI